MEKSSSLFFSLKNSGLEKRLVLIYQARGFLVVGVVIVVGVVVGVVIVVGVGVVFVVVSVMVGRMVVGGLGFMLLLGLMVGIGEGLMVEIEPGEQFCLSFDGKNLAPWVEEAAKRGRELSSFKAETGRKIYDDDDQGGHEGGAGEAPAVQFSYQVVEGGYMDIDVEVFDPKGKVLMKDEKKQVGKVRLKTSKKGELYTICMSNKFAKTDKKLVDFVLISSWSLVTRGEHLYPIEDAILKIESTVRSLNDEISFIFIQETFHLSTTEETFDRLTYATILEGVALIVVNFWQIRSLRHFFEVKRYL